MSQSLIETEIKFSSEIEFASELFKRLQKRYKQKIISEADIYCISWARLTCNVHVSKEGLIVKAPPELKKHVGSHFYKIQKWHGMRSARIHEGKVSTEIIDKLRKLLFRLEQDDD